MTNIHIIGLLLILIIYLQLTKSNTNIIGGNQNDNKDDNDDITVVKILKKIGLMAAALIATFGIFYLVRIIMEYFLQ